MAARRRVVIETVHDTESSSARRARGVGSSADVIPLEHETFEALLRVLLTFIPLAAVGMAGWLAWGGSLHWQDLLVLAVTYVLCGFGVTVGFHRLLTHRSFKTTRSLRALFAVFVR